MPDEPSPGKGPLSSEAKGGGLTEESIRQIVRRVVLRTLGPDGIRAPAAAAQELARRPQATLTEADVLAVPRGQSLLIPANTLITPLALDTAFDRRVELARQPGRETVDNASPVQNRQSPSGTSASARGSVAVIALGADHGGLSLKEDLKSYLGELGYQVIDCGTHSTAAVDYPDLAYAVAQLVTSGRAWRGIVVDGAGIGSCMAANKVPGVRAAMCYDHATAVNSREHNDANVLTLGATLIGAGLAHQIVKAWLETEFAGGRHARRVQKIADLERRFLK